ncbi:MAG: DUF2007 domain-containing protein [Acidimicrobiia bacterium]|jgi:hypothetical protein
MSIEASARFVRATTVGDLVSGQVLAARLRSEGIEVRLHSEALGPYPTTVGGLAATELWVPQDRLEEAAQILLDSEVRNALAPAEPEREPRLPPPLETRVVAAVVGVILLVLWLLRIVRVF